MDSNILYKKTWTRPEIICLNVNKTFGQELDGEWDGVDGYNPIFPPS